MASCSFVSSGRTFTLSVWESSVNAVANTSTFTWSASISGGGGVWYNSYIGVNVAGSTVYSKQTVWSDAVFPSADGTVSGTVTVNHNSDGSCPAVYMYIEGYSEVYSTQSASNYAYGTKIDRNAPTVSVSLSNASASSFKITASANATCDQWQYRIKKGSGSWGSWTALQTLTTQSTTATKTLTGLSANTTYYVQVYARRVYNQVGGYSSGTTNIKTLGGGVLNSVGNTTIDSGSPTSAIKWTCYSSSFTHTLKVRVGNSIYATRTLTATVGSNIAYTFTYTSSEKATLLNLMANTKTLTVSYDLITTSGSTQIGTTSTVTATLSVSSLSNPEWDSESWTYEDTDTETTAVTENNQVLIKAFSELEVTIPSATAKNGASITKYSVSIGGKTVDSTTSGAIAFGTIDNSYGEVAITISATDSRGNVITINGILSVLNFSEIYFNDYAIRRINNVEQEVHLAFSGRISTIMFDGVNKNALQSAKFRYKKTTDSTYSAYINLSVTATSYSFSFTTNDLGGVDFDSDFAYDIEVVVSDKISSDTLQLYLANGIPLISARSEKVGINMPNPQYALHIGASSDDSAVGINNISLKQYLAKTMLDIYFPVNTIYGTFDSTFDPNSAWGGTWIKITDGRVLVPSATPNVTGGSSTSGSHTLTASESGVGSHGHYIIRGTSYSGTNYVITLNANDGSSSNRYILAQGSTSSYTPILAKSVSANATSGHTHGSINPLNRSYCLWYRTA